MTQVDQLDQLPPFCEPSEQAVIGALLTLGRRAIEEAVSAGVSESSFFSRPRSQIWTKAVAMFERREVVDILTLPSAVHGIEGVDHELGLCLASAANDSTLDHFIQRLVNQERRRAVIKAVAERIGKLRACDDSEIDQSISELEAEIQAASDRGRKCEAVPSHQAVSDFIDELERRHERKSKGLSAGFLTGLRDIDRATDGLRLGEMTILGARPSIGKTAIGCQLVSEICIRQRQPTLFITCESSPRSLVERIIVSTSGISFRRTRQGDINEGDMRKLNSTAGVVAKSPLYFLNAVSGMDVDRITSAARRLIDQHKITFVVLDYLQKIPATGAHEKRTYEVGSVSGKLVGLARSCNVAFLVLAQLNRVADSSDIPSIGTLADSAQIERDADNILLLHRDKQNSPTKAILALAKQRDGELATAELAFNGDIQRFENEGVEPDK